MERSRQYSTPSQGPADTDINDDDDVSYTEILAKWLETSALKFPPVSCLPSRNCGQSSCVTYVEVVEFSFSWKIRNFSFCGEKVDEMLESSVFSSAGGEYGQLEWRLQVYPRGRRTNSEEYLSVYLELVSAIKTQVLRAKYKFSIVNSQGAIGHSAENEEGAKFVQRVPHGFDQFIRLELLHDRANGLLPNNSLTIVCDGTAGVNRVSHSQSVSGAQVEDTADFECQLADDFGALLRSPEYSDVTLSAGGKDIRAHKAILAARSSVFAAMFRSEMEESKLNRVTIEDMDFEVLREMLSYIYTGKSRLSKDLLVAADKYDLGGLKMMCQTVVCSSFTISNAAELLVLSERHCLKKLKETAIKFIEKHMEDVMLTPAWEIMILTHPHLINEVLGALLVGNGARNPKSEFGYRPGARNPKSRSGYKLAYLSQVEPPD